MKTKAMNSPEKTALLAHQVAIKEASASIHQLEKAIAKQEALISDAKAKKTDVEQLKLERKDALADAALGLDVTADLAALDASIEKDEALMRTIGPTVKQAQETVEGLSRRLQRDQEALEALTTKTAILQRRFLLSEAEAHGAVYAALAAELVKRYKVLMALNSLLTDKGHRPGIHPIGPQLHIPCFSLESNKACADVVSPYAIFMAPRTHADGMGWAREEASRLRADGIEID